MGLLSKDKKEEKVEKVAAEKTSVSTRDLAGVLLNPRITEKAAHQSEGSVYTFDVAPRASKVDIADAVEALYGVTVRKVAVARIPHKKVYRRTGIGTKGGGKKAYVYLEKGQTIEFV